MRSIANKNGVAARALAKLVRRRKNEQWNNRNEEFSVNRDDYTCLPQK